MITLSPVHSAQDVAPVWQKLCASVPHSFFLSWPWIENLLETSGSLGDVRLLTIGENSPAVAALLFKSTVSRRGLLRVRNLGLNTLDSRHPAFIPPEYLGLLVDPAGEAKNWELFLDHLQQTREGWDEVQLEGVAPELVDAWIRRGQRVRESLRVPSRFTDLARVRAAKDQSFLNVLNSRARSRVRSTTRGIVERLGPVNFEFATTPEQADEFFSEFKVLHDLRWKDDPTGGAFGAPGWEPFHRRLIARQYSNGSLALVRIKAGETTLGVLYYFLHQGRVLFYQCGINYSASVGSESPGLLIHATMIDHFAARGHDIYDFMAGDAQYKRTLATDSVDLWWGALQAPRLSLRAEAAAISAYRAMRSRFARAKPHAPELSKA
jgi:CelD/BcsL family acetyltransferase involved in cellulose biosynthesis